MILTSGSYLNTALDRSWSLPLPGTLTSTIPAQESRDNVLYTLPDYKDESATLVRRGMFTFLAKSSIGLAKAGAKSGAFNVVTNGASKLLHLRRRDVEYGDEGQKLVRRARGFKMKKGFKVGTLAKIFKKSAKVAPVAASGAAAQTAAAVKKSSGTGDKLNMASNVMMMGSMITPMLSGLGGGKQEPVAAVSPPAEQHATDATHPPSPPANSPPASHPPASHPSASHPSAPPVAGVRPAKRSIEGETEQQELQSLTRRGSVANMAGGAVTTLMFINIGKQVMGAVTPHIPGPISHTAAPAAPAGRAVYDTADDMVLYKRASDEMEKMHQRKPGVMEGMSSVVTLGFGGQAVQENAGPMYREVKRIAHGGQELAHHLLGHGIAARGLAFEGDSDDLVSRQVTDDQDDGKLIRRNVLPHAIKKVTPHIMSTTGHIVTVSMLTSMATPIVDSAIAAIKGPFHADNLQQHLARRSSLFLDDLSARDGHISPNTAKVQARQEGLRDEDIVLEKRINVGKALNQAMKNKIVKQVISVASLAL
jgi:hypothetical protein